MIELTEMFKQADHYNQPRYARRSLLINPDHVVYVKEATEAKKQLWRQELGNLNQEFCLISVGGWGRNQEIIIMDSYQNIVGQLGEGKRLLNG